MIPEVYWVPEVPFGRIGIAGRPRAGEWLADEIRGWRQLHMSTVVSLLEPAEVRELGLSDEPALCAANGIRFVSFPIPDRGVPASASDFFTLATQLADELKSCSTVVIHCRAGIGRSGLLVAAVLAETGLSVSEAFTHLSRARRVSVPDTPEQANWLHDNRRHPGRLPGSGYD